MTTILPKLKQPIIKQNRRHQIQKRVFDIVFSLFALIFFSPIFLIIAIFIKLKSPNGNILFIQRRLGKDGHLFKVYKFRTMTPDAEKTLETWLTQDEKLKEEYVTYRKLKEDPRIIKGVGNFLRKTSLDELPQFLNVLKGEMSVVGPRPYIFNEFDEYKPKNHIDIISSVKPGVTGLWQVTERNNTTFNSRVEKDIEYINSQSFWLDSKIIIQTVRVMVFREGN
jgi:undecaprenyl-phosphate galactose phosphotransferase